MGIDGLNFADQARPAPPQPPREIVHVHAVSPDRDALEIVFPRVEGYRTDFPKERIDVDLSRLEPYVLDARQGAAPRRCRCRASSASGTSSVSTISTTSACRPSPSTSPATGSRTSCAIPNGAPKTYLFPHAKRIVLQWLNSDRLVCKGDTKAAQLRYRQLTDEVCDLLMGALLDQPGGQPIIRATLDPFSPEGSTANVNFTTSKASRHWPRPDR